MAASVTYIFSPNTRIQSAQVNQDLTDLTPTYSAYVPTWANMSIGDATVVGRYQQTGKFVHAWGSMVWGSLTSISGVMTLSLPVNAHASYSSDAPLGTVNFYDSNTTANFVGRVALATAGTAYLTAYITNDVYGTPAAMNIGVPFGWTVNDTVKWNMILEAA